MQSSGALKYPQQRAGLLGKLGPLLGIDLRGAVTDPVLQADLEALGRLKPQPQTLVWQVTQGLLHEIPAGGSVDAGAVPPLAAAQELSTRTLCGCF